MEVYEYPGYRCGPCPPGLQGNGTHCTDINEVGKGGIWKGTDSRGEDVRREMLVGSSVTWGLGEAGDQKRSVRRKVEGLRQRLKDHTGKVLGEWECEMGSWQGTQREAGRGAQSTVRLGGKGCRWDTRSSGPRVIGGA